jgi:two-component system OmpR family sensor kinase
MRRFVPQGIRLRLVLAISAVSAITVGASFIALHAGTGSDLRAQIDDELRTQYAGFKQQVIDKGEAQTPAQLERASQQFVAGQRYHPESRIFAIGVTGQPEVTNQRAIVEKELEGGVEQGESGEGGEGARLGLLNSPSGLSTISNEEAGQLRVLNEPIKSGADQIGTFRAAVPLTSVTEAQQGLRKTFVAVGLGALALAVAIAIWLANVISRPLRRMAGVAARIDAGDLGHRIDYRGKDEVGVLAEAFNHMLDRLEAGFRRQRQFVSDASHELRSPLTVLRGRIELLARSGGDADAIADEAEEILREIGRMDRLVADMLTLAQAERGKLLQKRPIRVADFADDLRRDLPLLGERSYTVDSQLAGTLDADPDRLAQVIRNLVSNAVRHTGPGGRISVSLDARNGSALFAVSDDGDGIPPDRLERVFDRFYRTDEGRGRDEGGSGLGLAIARAIVEAHGGTISAESPAGTGTTIRFEIPGFAPGG